MIAWHYTTRQNFRRILESGAILCARESARPGEKPVAWFSLNTKFEPTARKAVREHGVLRTLSVEETYRLGGGLARFGCPLRILKGGESLRKEASIGRQEWAALLSAGKGQGSRPSDWFGSIKPVSLSSVLKIEVMGDDMQWSEFRP